MPRVLMLAYHYPPVGGAGVQRTLKFSRYLPDFGWQPVVLTVPVSQTGLIDSSMASGVPEGVDVHRASAVILPRSLPWRMRNWITRWFLVVDGQVGWLPFATRMGKDILAEGQIDAVYSTSSPATAHLVARRLCLEKRLPWVADFRDPWLDNFDAVYPTPLHRRYIARLEQAVCRDASAVTVVSEPMRQKFLDAYPDLAPGKVVTLTNGYDLADLEHATPVSLQEGAFHLVYTGSFYARNRSPEAFLIALKQLIERGMVLSGKICIHLVGNVGRAALQIIDELHLGDVVSAPGYLPHAESIGYLMAADALLLVIGSDPGSEVVFTGKLFEYLAARRPILALAPPGPAASLIREASAGSVVDPGDVDAIAADLLDFYRRWEQGSLRLESRDEVIERYDRRRLTSRLADLLNSITGKQSNP